MKPEYKSIFADLIQAFIEYKRSAGYKYATEAVYLKKFDDLCCSLDLPSPVITKELMDAWCQGKPYESTRNSRQQRISCIRQFSLYLTSIGHEAYIPVNLDYICQRKSKYSAYIFTHEEMEVIFQQSNRIYPNRRSTMHLVMPVLVRLLYCTGLRIMEALHLQLKNVDLMNGILRIEQAKFNKDRMVPVSDSMLDILKQYCAVMHPLYLPEDYLFIGITRDPCSHHNIYLRFRELLTQAGIKHAGRGYGPRIHDIRHTHCCHVLQRADLNGTDLSNMLPALSVYMGHESIAATSQYLKMTAEVYTDVIATVEKLCSQAIPEVKT
ncbi:MAG: tyrosine-type recombinase/integrase [Clostridium sp.]